MKIKIHLKDTDTLYEAIKDAVDEIDMPGLNQEELDAIKELRKEEYADIANRWFQYGEYVSLEMDTEEKTMVVLPKIT